MDYSYPILKKVFDTYNKIPHNTDNLFLVCCQHMMEPQLKMFGCLIDFGFDPNRIIVLGKAYSTNNEVLSELKIMGINALQPEFSGIDFDQEHKNNCASLLSLIPRDKDVILLDDGAELIKIFADHAGKVKFGVEQTSSGFRRLEKENLPFAVFNVARSVTKLTQESPLVARHLCERILAYLENKQVQDPTVLVVGLGPIGSALFEILKQSNINIEGFDIKYGHTDLLSKIQNLKPDVIIGATGTGILNKEEINNLLFDKPLYLISASSSDREFPVASFRSDEGVHDDVTYKNITFVNNGFPFSFMGNRYEMTPIEIEKTMCLLGGSVMYGVARSVPGGGLLEVPQEIENVINQ